MPDRPSQPARDARAIAIRGAREHNLKNIDVAIPRDQLVVFTGLSGSGKSSLAFDTIYAEGQRRYVESLSAYARQFLEMMQKPDVDQIDGLSPAISIEQKTTSKNPRSTVGTVTEIYDYMRLLWARIGVPYSPATGLPIESQTVSQMVDRVLALPEGTRIYVLAPVVRGRKGEYRKELAEFLRKGYQRVKIDGAFHEIDAVKPLDKKFTHDIDVVVDRLVVKSDIGTRLADSLEQCLKLADGLAIVELADTKASGAAANRGRNANAERLIFSEKFACPVSGFTISEIEPRLFSFNNPFGACPECGGLGVEQHIDADLIIPDRDATLKKGAIAPWAKSSSPYYVQTLDALAKHFRFTLDTKWKDLPKKTQDAILYGSGEDEIKFVYDDGLRGYTTKKPFEGVITNLERRFKETESEWAREDLLKYFTDVPCHECHGARLKPEALCVKIAGKNISEIAELSVRRAGEWFTQLPKDLNAKQNEIGVRVLKEIRERLKFLVDVGLDYLTLARASGTLSGGESQRIRLASQIGSGLTGVLYVLDEPSIGLHQRDNARLLETLKRLRDLGNTVIVVEHDEDAIRTADYVLDIGPGAGIHGGHIVAEGAVADLIAAPRSWTGKYLSGELSVPVPERQPRNPRRTLKIVNARGNNLKGIDAEIPLGLFTCVTGVSGGGKSTLLIDTLYNAVARKLNGASLAPAPHDRIEGLEHIDKIIDIDQSPIGRTPRSNPATYTGAFTPIREWFAALPEIQGARLRARPLLVQRQGRPLRGLPGRRRHQDRDALSARRLRHLRRLQGQALQPRDAGGAVQGQVDRRRARHDGGRGAGILQGGAARARRAGAAAPRRPRLHPCRPAGDHALRRRGAARQARQGAVEARHRPHALYPRRADHRPALPRRGEAARRAARAGGDRQFGGGDRAQPGSDQDRRLDHRSRPRRRRRRRRDRRAGHAGGYCEGGGLVGPKPAGRRPKLHRAVFEARAAQAGAKGEEADRSGGVRPAYFELEQRLFRFFIAFARQVMTRFFSFWYFPCSLPKTGDALYASLITGYLRVQAHH